MLPHFKRWPWHTTVLFVLFSILTSPAEAGTTLVVQINSNSLTPVNNTLENGLNYTTLFSDLVLGLDAFLKLSLPGNSTDTENSSEGIGIWSWLIIGGGFLALLAVIIGLYVDERNRLDGYEKMITEAANAPSAGSRVISVALVHPCHTVAPDTTPA
jgi:hypothetical protein